MPKWNSDPTGLTVFSDCGGQPSRWRLDPKTGAQWCASWGAGRVSATSEFPPKRGEFYQNKVAKELNAPMTRYDNVRSSGLSGRNGWGGRPRP